MSKLLKPAELGIELGVSKDLTLRMARRGQIPFVRLGCKTLRFQLDDVLAALGTVPCGSQPSNASGKDTITEGSQRVN